MKQTYKVALLGNPNSGKSSLFNLLTGLRQKVGNFPGVTVDKKTGSFSLEGDDIKLTDLPGAYSLCPISEDEKVVVQFITNPKDQHYPDAIMYVADSLNLEKHLLLFTQLKDLGLPSILVLHRADLGVSHDKNVLEAELKSPVVEVSSRLDYGVDELKRSLSKVLKQENKTQSSYQLSKEEKQLAKALPDFEPDFETYRALVCIHHSDMLEHISPQKKELLRKVKSDIDFNSLASQIKETQARFEFIKSVLDKASLKQIQDHTLTDRIDRWLTQPVFGLATFLLLMLLVFQALYSWSAYPMDAIEGFFTLISENVQTYMPKAWYTDLITSGILTGLGGVLVFIPQIAILFFALAVLEELGYMARVMYLFDNLFQSFGLNGRSIVALISGGACAVPAIMSTRTIGNWKERLITILVTPFISCSARLPVYTVLIGFVVPADMYWGVFKVQAIAFLGLYVLGACMALFIAWMLKIVLKSTEKSFLIIELPSYQVPLLRNVFYHTWEKVKVFALEAGKVILLISIGLWFFSKLWIWRQYVPGKRTSYCIISKARTQ